MSNKIHQKGKLVTSWIYFIPFYVFCLESVKELLQKLKWCFNEEILYAAWHLRTYFYDAGINYSLFYSLFNPLPAVFKYSG